MHAAIIHTFNEKIRFYDDVISRLPDDDSICRELITREREQLVVFRDFLMARP
jgi:hypothetical protein